jgi:hypothetical protein
MGVYFGCVRAVGTSGLEPSVACASDRLVHRTCRVLAAMPAKKALKDGVEECRATICGLIARTGHRMFFNEATVNTLLLDLG